MCSCTLTALLTATTQYLLIDAAWTTSPLTPIASTSSSMRTITRRFPTFLTPKYVTHRTDMNIFSSSSSDHNFLDPSSMRNTTAIPKRSQQPAFGQVRHQPKLQPRTSGENEPSKSSNMKTKPTATAVTVTTTIAPKLHLVSPPGRRDKKSNSDGSITSLHTSRIQNAGRVGTKRYINPCKVYFGNLSYQIKNKKILHDYVVQQLGLPSHILLKECNIVTDWKTNQPKGYGFVIFTEPIYATIAITKLHGTTWYNRTITVNQGVHKQNMEELQSIYQNAYRKQQIRLEEERNGTNQQLKKDDEIIFMDAKEAALLKHLDPDLLRGVQIIPATNGNADPKKMKNTAKVTPAKAIVTDGEDVDVDDDEYEYDVDYDDDETEYEFVDDEIYEDDLDEKFNDNIVLFDDDDDKDYDIDDNRSADDSSTSTSNDEEISTTKNRQQRRDDAKSRKKIKLPRKGFG